MHEKNAIGSAFENGETACWPLQPPRQAQEPIRRTGDTSQQIISWTLAGPDGVQIIGDAIRSAVAIADFCMVIDTDPVTLRWPELLIEADEASSRRTLMRRWPWRDDFAAARNAALDFAAQAGAAWGIMLDSDERIVCPDPAAMRAYLAELPDVVQVVAAKAADGSHARERFFRLPARYRFIGRTHEAFPVSHRGEQALAPPELVTWRELPKMPEQLRAKFKRDLGMLDAEIAEHPDDPRWHYYRGCSLQSLERHEEALESFRACMMLGGGEGPAFACVRAAQSLLVLKRYDRAIDACCAGMARYPGIAELYGLAGVACLQQGRLDEAEDFARLAKVHALGSDAEQRRMAFRLPEWLTTGPDEILEVVRRTRAGEAVA